MDVTVEIGNLEQKDQITQELTVLVDIAAKFDPPLNISQLVVPSHFDEKVNALQGTTTYRAFRDVTALAKTIEVEPGNVVIVVSPHLYTKGNDGQVRLLVYLHEIIHVVNKRTFLQLSYDSPSEATYMAELHTLYDEYLADRIAFKFGDQIFPSKSVLFQEYIHHNLDGFISLVNDVKYYEIIKEEIASFRVYKTDVSGFVERIHSSASDLALSIVHLYSLFHQYPELSKQERLLKSHFINEKTLALINFFKSKYEPLSFDLQDGLHLVAEFMTNFGVKYEDIPQGMYCHVLDI